MSEAAISLEQLPEWLAANPEFDPLSSDLLEEESLAQLQWLAAVGESPAPVAPLSS
jgi:hypothetical protein